MIRTLLIFLMLAIPASAQTIDPATFKATAEGSGYYRVYVDDVEVSRHTTERKALEAMIHRISSNPDAVHHYDHDYRVYGTADLVTGPPEPEPDPTPDPEPDPTPDPDPVDPDPADPNLSGVFEALHSHPNLAADYTQIDRAWIDDNTIGNLSRVDKFGWCLDESGQPFNCFNEPIDLGVRRLFPDGKVQQTIGWRFHPHPPIDATKSVLISWSQKWPAHWLGVKHSGLLRQKGSPKIIHADSPSTAKMRMWMLRVHPETGTESTVANLEMGYFWRWADANGEQLPEFVIPDFNILPDREHDFLILHEFTDDDAGQFQGQHVSIWIDGELKVDRLWMQPSDLETTPATSGDFRTEWHLDTTQNEVLDPPITRHIDITKKLFLRNLSFNDVVHILSEVK